MVIVRRPVRSRAPGPPPDDEEARPQPPPERARPRARSAGARAPWTSRWARDDRTGRCGSRRPRSCAPTGAGPPRARGLPCPPSTGGLRLLTSALFRVPAGLADGLALKELRYADHRDSPPAGWPIGSPAPSIPRRASACRTRGCYQQTARAGRKTAASSGSGLPPPTGRRPWPRRWPRRRHPHRPGARRASARPPSRRA